MNPLLSNIEREGLSRRRFLRHLFLKAGGVAGARFLTACGGSSRSVGPQGAVNPFVESGFATMGPLLPPDENGVQLPAGFTSRIVGEYNANVITDHGTDTGYAWHTDPDGGATFKTEDGGWIYVSNSERRDSTTGPALEGASYEPPNRRQDVALAGLMSGGVSAL